ncbi:hypothetical protein [Acetoanaerobium noterae]|uniref:hypothetical protein n=1 Tax=Acetoanaerobium noterae TaxID=745369 RepID=UPI00331C2F76
MVVQKQEEVLINAQGEFLQILYEYPETLEEGQSIVPLSNYYDVLNEERYDMSVWDFAQEKWTGKGEQRPETLPQPNVEERLKMAEETILFLMDMNLGGV